MINTCDTCKWWSDIPAVLVSFDGDETGIVHECRIAQEQKFTDANDTCEGYEKGNPVDG